ncbi:MAG: hypothetical protein ACPK85_06380 [Methanosarcina sp.]
MDLALEWNWGCCYVVDSHIIREQDPLKQGLKPEVEPGSLYTETDSRARSIKTRIEN